MINIQGMSKIQFNRVMKRRRIRTSIIAVLMIVSFIYIVGLKSYEHAINKSYCKYLINMDSGNSDIEKLRNRGKEFEEEIDIKDINYDLDNSIEVGNKPKSLIIHHTAVENITPEMINTDHKKKGYGGIGYHFYIRRDGTIYRGRPEEDVGAHTIGRNRDSLGICLEGNFEEDVLTEEQEKSLIKLLADMIIKYNISDIIGHKDSYQTLCPGKNISLDDIRQNVKNEIISISR